MVLPVADKGALLFFSDEADVLADVALRLSLWQVFLVVLVEVLDRGKEGVVPATFRDAGGVNWLSLDGVDGLLLFHSSYYVVIQTIDVVCRSIINPRLPFKDVKMM